MTMPRLSIAIPTFKRPRFLEKCVKEVLDQAETFGEGAIEILVLDDSDGAENAPVIARLAAHPAGRVVRYRINEFNLGIDENIKACILEANGDYVWLLGEDDLLLPGAVRRVFDALADDPPVFVFANYWYSDGEHVCRTKAPVLPADRGDYVVPFDAFVSERVWALGFIGGCIIRRRAWAATEFERYAGSFYSHVGGIIDATFGKKMLVLSAPLVLNRAEDVDTFTWSSSTFAVYHSFYAVLDASRLSEQPRILDSARRAAASLFAVDSLSWLAAKRADGVYDAAVFRTYYSKRNGSLWRLIARCLASAPRGPLRLVRRMHLKARFVRSNDSVLGADS